jgi:hypothetical protein
LIANKTEYSEIRKRYKVHKAIGKILLKQHLDYIVYATYRGNKLIIMAKNHIAQNELNYQKMVLLKYLKQIKEFENIETVSILRWDKEIRGKGMPEFSLKKEETLISNPTFVERSYGIFENNTDDKKLYSMFENIRETIRNNKESSK